MKIRWWFLYLGRTSESFVHSQIVLYYIIIYHIIYMFILDVLIKLIMKTNLLQMNLFVSTNVVKRYAYHCMSLAEILAFIIYRAHLW